MILDNSQIQHVRLWETPVFLIKNEDHVDIKDELKSYIYSQEKLQKSSIDSNVALKIKSNLSESTFDFLNRDSDIINRLSQFIIQACSTCISNINQQLWGRYRLQNRPPPELEIHESWYHITRPGGYHSAHSHTDCSWCAIYYVDIGEEDDAGSMGGKNIFYRPFETGYRDPGTDWFKSNQWEPSPQDGVLVLFPSYLMHCAIPYTGKKKDRIVIAMNMRVNEIK